jgi:hypothetical protein
VIKPLLTFCGQQSIAYFKRPDGRHKGFANFKAFQDGIYIVDPEKRSIY